MTKHQRDHERDTFAVWIFSPLTISVDVGSICDPPEDGTCFCFFLTRVVASHG